MNVENFFESHHLRTPEKREVLALMKGGASFKDAMQKVADDWIAAEEGTEMSTELEGFLYTNRELQRGIYDNEISA